MNRRAFLQLLGLAAPALALDPERLLWTPKPMITVPAMPLAVSHEICTADWMAREALKVLEQRLKMANYINAHYDDRFDARVGQTVRIRRPGWYAAGVDADVRDFDTRDLPAMVEALQQRIPPGATFVKPSIPKGVEEGAVAVNADGVAVRALRLYDIGSDTDRWRLDVRGSER